MSEVIASSSPQTKRNVEELDSPHVNQVKNKILGTAFTVLGVGFVTMVFVIILYYNYLMIEPYLIPILLALLLAIPLGVIRDAFLATVESAEISLGMSNRPYTALLAAILVPLGSVLIGAFTIIWAPQLFGALAFPLLALSFFFVALAWKSNREFLLTVAIIIFLLVIILFPMFFLLKSCFQESVVATDAIVSYIKQNNELQTLMKDHKNSSLYKQAVAYAESWGWDPNTLDIDQLKEQAMGMVQAVGKNVNVFFGSSLSIVSNVGSIIVGFFIFSTTLFTVVLYKRYLWEELAELSPFASEEQSMLINSLGNSVSRIIMCSFAIGIIHFTATWISFALTGLQLKYIFSALSAFLSIVPLSGTWLIWVPAAGILAARGEVIHCVCVVAFQILAMYLNGVVLSYLPGNPHYVGMSIALGLGTFGPVGVIMGPLLAGLVMTLAEIYKGFYIKARIPSKDVTPLKSHARSRTLI